MTKEEKRLWYDFLKNHPLTFHRQKVLGSYVVDFYCAAAGLVIELDGSQHASDEGIARDAERDAYLEGLGLYVLRIGNYNINKYFNSVCDGIQEIIDERTLASPLVQIPQKH